MSKSISISVFLALFILTLKFCRNFSWFYSLFRKSSTENSVFSFWNHDFIDFSILGSLWNTYVIYVGHLGCSAETGPSPPEGFRQFALLDLHVLDTPPAFALSQNQPLVNWLYQKFPLLIYSKTYFFSLLLNSDCFIRLFFQFLT